MATFVALRHAALADRRLADARFYPKEHAAATGDGGAVGAQGLCWPKHFRPEAPNF